MRYFLYRMQSDERPPGGGDFRSWLHFYKWGRSETVTFRKRTPYFEDVKKGDVMFFVLDGFLIGDALISNVHNDVFLGNEGAPVQELDVAEKGIWEYDRSWDWLDRLTDRVRLVGLKNEVPFIRGARWLQWHRHIWATEIYPNWFVWGARGRVAVYNPDVKPPFLSIPRKK